MTWKWVDFDLALIAFKNRRQGVGSHSLGKAIWAQWERITLLVDFRPSSVLRRSLFMK